MPPMDELELAAAALEEGTAEVRDVFRLGEWVVALGEDSDGLGGVAPVGWNIKVAGGEVREIHTYDSWSRALVTAGGWDVLDGDAGVSEARIAERPSELRARSHPHRAPSVPSVRRA